MKKAVIFCGGEVSGDVNGEISGADMIICADGGFRRAADLGITPDIIIGDRDSVSGCYPTNIQSVVYPAEKDKTDTALCVDYAMERGCAEAVILGGLGGRLDHEFANYELLMYGLNRGMKIRLCDSRNEIWLENRPFYLEKNEKKYVSFFPFGGTVEGLTIKGLKYETDNMFLNGEITLTCSNEFAECDRAHISFTKGTLMVMRCSDK